MKNLEQYVGRKVKGVKFTSEHYRGIAFNSKINTHIGCEGTITEYYESNNSFRIEFESPVKDHWCYPAEVILPQLEGELVGYLVNTDDEKYVKIIAGLANHSVESLLELTSEGVHFTPKSYIGEIVAKYDLLDKCTPVYKSDEVKLPKINGFKMKEESEDSFHYGCAELLKAWFDSSNNRSIVSMTLDSGVVINKEQINKIQEYLLSKRK